MTDWISALKQWTGKQNIKILFDSTVDEFTHDGLFNKTRGKQDIALIAFTTDGDIFGVFHSVAATGQNQSFPDPNVFVFSFESHGRCATPQRFALKEHLKDKGNICVFKTSANGFIDVWVEGGGVLFIGNEKSNACTFNMTYGFEGLASTVLVGHTGHHINGPFFRCFRVLAVQLLN